jgi:alkylhydroperoxidase/carboxymuconolactone decarboxylase family protein YurZ
LIDQIYSKDRINSSYAALSSGGNLITIAAVAASGGQNKQLCCCHGQHFGVHLENGASDETGLVVVCELSSDLLT